MTRVYAYLDSFLVVLDVVTVNVVMRSDGLLQLGANDVTRSLGGGTAGEKHDARTGVLERCLQQSNRDTQGNTCTSQRSLVVRDGPWVTLHLLQDVGDLEFGLLNGQEEPCCRSKRRPGRLMGHVRTQPRGKSQHFLNLLRSIFLASTEDIRLGTFSVAELVNLCLYARSTTQFPPMDLTVLPNSYHCTECNQTNQSIRGK